MKTVISAPNAPAPIAPFSPALRVGDWIYLSGAGGFDPSTGQLVSEDVTGQTVQLFRNVEELLTAAGATLDDVVSCLVHLTDLDDFAEFNRAYSDVFVGTLPVRTTVRADLVAGMRVEVTVVAYRPATSREATAPA